MSTERMMILKMVESKKITPAEAEILFRALGDEDGNSAEDGTIEGISRPAEPFLGDRTVQIQGNTPEQNPIHSASPTPTASPNVISKFAKLFSRPSAAAKPRSHRASSPDPSYAAAMKRTGRDFTVQQLMRMQDEEIEPDQAAELAGASQPDWTTDEIIEMMIQGISPELLLALKDLRLDNLVARDVLQLAEHDVDTDFLRQFSGMHMDGMSVHDLIEFYDNDVSPDLAIALRETGPVSTQEIVHAAENDLSEEFVSRVEKVMPGTSVDQLIDLVNNDVSPEFIENLVRGGFFGLTAEQIIQLQDNDVDAREAIWFHNQLGDNVTVDGLVQLACHDIHMDYVKPLVKLNLADLNVDTLIEMADHDVCVDVIKKAQKLYGNEVTTRILIEIADNW